MPEPEKCSFVPRCLTDSTVTGYCVEHDRVYRDTSNGLLDKWRSDLKLGASVFVHGLRLTVAGPWYMLLGIIMAVATLLFGWWAWFHWRKRKV